MKLVFKILLLFLVSFNLYSMNLDSLEKGKYFLPKIFNQTKYNYFVGFSLSYLPLAIVEEEIANSPMLNLGFRINYNNSFYNKIELSSNYIANIGSLGTYYNIINRDISLGVGLAISSWFGHLELDAFKVKTFGVIGSPSIQFGINFGKLKLSTSAEFESNYYKTLSDDKLLGEKFQKFSGFNLKINLEQPLWKDNWVATSVKLSYTKFYYQSWVSFNQIQEFLLYPEFSFSFIL